MSALSVALAGGGTGGHIEPMLALADALRRRDHELRITCLGTARGMETRLVPARGYDLQLIPPVPLPRKPTVDLLRVPGRVRRAVADTRGLLDELGADVVVGFGGYVALPAYLAARRARVPVVVHEQNALPGLANRIGARVFYRTLGRLSGVNLDNETIPALEHVWNGSGSGGGCGLTGAEVGFVLGLAALWRRRRRNA